MRDRFILQHSLAVLEKFRSQFVDKVAERLGLRELALGAVQLREVVLFRYELDSDKAFVVVYARIISERLDPDLLMMFEQRLFHRSSLSI
jgi:hypothetical protein